MNMFVLVISFRPPLASEAFNSGRARGIVLNPGSGAQWRDMRDWDDGHRGSKLVHEYRTW
ncbi:MAG: hypothetical protein WA633_01880 [Stellaceae bacterium]